MSFIIKLLDHKKSVAIIIIYTVAFLFIFALMMSTSFRQKMAQKWKSHRCNPFLMPVSGFFRDPDDPRGFFEFTVDNTKKCTESIFKKFFNAFTEPLRHIFDIISNIIKDLVDVLNRFRFHHKITRTLFKEIVGNIAAKISNTYAALQFYQTKLLTLINQQKSLLSIMMMFMKAIGVTIESLINGPLTALIHFLYVFMIGILVLLGICQIANIFTPEDMPTAKEMWFSPLYPYQQLLTLAISPVGDSPTIPIPELMPAPPFYLAYIPCAICFHPDTPIRVSRDKHKPIDKIDIGDPIYDGGYVISILRFYVGKNSNGIYNYHGIILSGSHMICEQGRQPQRVSDSEDSIPIEDYDSDWLICLNTSHGYIWSGNHRFADFWECTCDITNIKTQLLIEEAVNDFEKDRQTSFDMTISNRCDYPLYQSGIDKDTYIKMADGKFRQIKDIVIGDRTLHGGIVLGIIQHDCYYVKMYKLKHLIASGSQLIYHQNKWIRLCNHPDSNPYSNLFTTRIYHITTETGQIETLLGDKLRDYLELPTIHPVFEKIHRLNHKAKYKKLVGCPPVRC